MADVGGDSIVVIIVAVEELMVEVDEGEETALRFFG
jgi:hypothetical protein